MMRTLILAPFDQQQLKRLRTAGEVTYESWLDTRRLTDPDELGRRLGSEGISVLVIEADFVFEETMSQAPDLRFIGVCRASTNHVEIDVANERGVLVVNTPGRNARAVAELALGLMLSLSRRITNAHKYVTSGEWRHPIGAYIGLRGVEITGRTLGIVGLGAIGRSLAQMAVALGMHVRAFDPYVVCPPEGVVMVSLQEVFAQADFVSLHVPTSPATEGIIDGELLSLMNSEAYLINCSDSAIVDEGAVVEALRNRAIAGAAFDVFETQPISPDSPLLTLDNVILTPHIGGATRETVERHSRMMADDILRFGSDMRPVNLVNPEVWNAHR